MSPCSVLAPVSAMVLAPGSVVPLAAQQEDCVTPATALKGRPPQARCLTAVEDSLIGPFVMVACSTNGQNRPCRARECVL